MTITICTASRFLSTLSLRRATRCSCCSGWPLVAISIHALLAESDFIMTITICTASRFLSTLSLRRATTIPRGGHISKTNFYPRSPCGERLRLCRLPLIALLISIHALLAESDFIMTITICTASRFLSTLSLRRATRRSVKLFRQNYISIHALLAESDNYGVSE